MLDRYFDELSVGEVIEGSRGRTLTEADLALFSAVSGDWHPLHNDDAYARGSTFGSRIAHGLLTLSVMTGLAPISGAAVAGLYGFDRIRFVAPVRLGDTIRYRLRVAQLSSRKDGLGLADLEFEVYNQHGKACVVGVIKLLGNPRPGAEVVATSPDHAPGSDVVSGTTLAGGSDEVLQRAGETRGTAAVQPPSTTTTEPFI